MEIEERCRLELRRETVDRQNVEYTQYMCLLRQATSRKGTDAKTKRTACVGAIVATCMLEGFSGQLRTGRANKLDRDSRLRPPWSKPSLLPRPGPLAYKRDGVALLVLVAEQSKDKS